MLTRRRLITSLAFTPLLASPALAAKPEIYAENGIAIDGSDAVAYFTQGEPVAGSATHSIMWKGAEWRFSNAENLALFEADPEAYAPQYGGYCAWAVAQGSTASTIPEAWAIHDGKLYLNFSGRIQRRWNRDVVGNIAKGDANWPSVIS
jgi:YHS domain-containing protein